MRCEAVVSELATPTPDRDRAAMADHLASCSACAEWARPADRLDQLWEATRPTEPSPEAWDSVWGNIAGALPCPRRPTLKTPWRPGLVLPSMAAGSRSSSRPRRNLLPRRPAPAGAPGRGGSPPLPWSDWPRPPRSSSRWAWPCRAPPHSQDSPTDHSVITSNLEPAAPAPIRVAKPVTVKEEFDAGCLMVIRMEEGTAPRLINATPPEMNTGSDPGSRY